MAISTAFFNKNTGLQIQNAYMRIEQLTSNDNGVSATLSVRISREFATIDSFSMQIPFDAELQKQTVSYAKVYERIKELPQFSDAIDC